MTQESKTRLNTFIKKALFLLALGVAYYLFIKLTGWGIPCPIYLITKRYCPGCGISRMCIALLELDFPTAFHNNALVLSMLPFGLIFGMRNLISYVKTGRSEPDQLETVLLIITAVITVAFWFLRNQPNFSFLAPD